MLTDRQNQELEDNAVAGGFWPLGAATVEVRPGVRLPKQRSPLRTAPAASAGDVATGGGTLVETKEER